MTRRPTRVSLGDFPTRLHRADHLAAAIGSTDDLWIKRDDLTGFSWGGNKVRAIEFLLGDALEQGATEVILAGGPSSNFAALMAAAATSRGLATFQVSYGCEPAHDISALAATRRAGAQVCFNGSSDRSQMDVDSALLAIERSNAGQVPYVVPRGGASAVGAVGFFAAAEEFGRQVDALGARSGNIVIPLGSGGSTAGLLAGLAANHRPWTVTAVSVSRPPEEIEEPIINTAVTCATLMGCSVRPADITSRLRIVDGRGDGFGALSVDENLHADHVAACTGLLIDPTYNAKSLYWMRSAGALEGPVVYWHTGGALGALDRLLNNQSENHSQ